MCRISTFSGSPLTALDADCLCYRQLTGAEEWRTASLVRLNYTHWRVRALPGCQRVAGFGQWLCDAEERLGLRHDTRAELEALLEATAVAGGRPLHEFRAAVTV